MAPDNSPAPIPPPPRRRWLRLSLRGLMILVLILGGLAGWAAHTIRTQRAAVAVVRASGNRLQFDWEMDPIGTKNGRRVFRTEPTAPRWLRRWLGDELFQSVRMVNLYNPGPPELLPAVARFDRLERLFVSELASPEGLAPALRELRRLKWVSLSAPLTTDAALAAVGQLPSISEFSVTADRLKRLKAPATDAGFAQLAGLTNLESLLLWDCPNLTDPTMARLVARFPRLRQITLRHMLTDHLTTTLPALARDHPDLRLLNLDGSGVTDADLVAVAGISKLESLSLQVTRITDAGLAHLYPLQNLKYLTLNGTKVTDAGMKSVARIARLEGLSMLAVPITDASLADLAPLTNLRSLTLLRTPVTDAGMATIARFPTLQSLGLPTAITDAGLAALAKLPILKSIEVSGSQVTPAGIAALRRAVPTLTRVINTPFRPTPPPAAL